MRRQESKLSPEGKKVTKEKLRVYHMISSILDRVSQNKTIQQKTVFITSRVLG